MYEEDYPNYEKYRVKAESMIGKWFIEKDDFRPYDYYYVYDVSFNTEMNDWTLDMYKVSRVFNIIETDDVYLEDLSQYFKRISAKVGLKAYTDVIQYLDSLFNGQKVEE